MRGTTENDNIYKTSNYRDFLIKLLLKADNCKERLVLKGDFY